MELRATFAAYAVQGDGNCLWRAVSHGLWGDDSFWRQLKLVVLGYAAANAEDLVGENRHLHASSLYYENGVHEKFQVVVDGILSDMPDTYEMMLLSHVAKMCPAKVWGTGLCAYLASEALGIKLKVVDPTDMRSRKRQDAEIPERGTGRNGSTFDDQRVSRNFSPYGDPCEWYLPGSNGENRIFREEVVIVFAAFGQCVAEAGLVGVGEVGKDTNVGGLNHFSSVMRKDGSSKPFPLHVCSPPRFSALVSLPRVVSF